MKYLGIALVWATTVAGVVVLLNMGAHESASWVGGGGGFLAVALLCVDSIEVIKHG